MRIHSIAGLAPALLLLLAASAGIARSEEIVLLPEKDGTLVQHPGGFLSNAKGNSFYVGRAFSTRPNDQRLRRGLIRFDIAGAIPPGATITSAQLDLYMQKRRSSKSGDRDISLHRLLNDWGEGTSSSAGGGGDSTSEDDASWIHTFNPDGRWDTPGGDFDAAPVATIPVGGIGPYTFPTSPAMVSAVQAWLDDDANNFGWIVIGEESEDIDRSTRRFSSRENRFADRWPRLRIEFDAPDEALCRLSRVNLANELREDVLTVNGSAGGGEHRVTVMTGETISIDMAASSAGPDPAPFVLYLVLGEPDASDLRPMPKNLGNFCFDMPLFGAEVRAIWNNVGRVNKLGEPDFPSDPAPSNVIMVPGGSDVAATATMQAILLDDGSSADVPGSLTNAIVLDIVEP